MTSFPSKTFEHAGKQLRRLMQLGECVCLPGAFNGLVGRLCAQTGHNACYLSGGALSATHGVPDIGLLTLDDFTRAIRDISLSSGLPVLSDADTGFGEAEMITKVVWEYSHAGAAGLHIEDQEFPKKCGHLDGKRLIPAADFCHKVRYAAAARDACSQGDFIICARTDAAAVEGLNAAIQRATQYTEAGADMIFPEGLNSVSDFEYFASKMKSLRGEAPGGGPYLLANMTEFGKTPSISVQMFQQLGYHAVIFPVSALRVAMKAVQNFLTDLKATGCVDQDVLSRMYTRKDLYSTLKYDPTSQWTYPSTSSER